MHMQELQQGFLQHEAVPSSDCGDRQMQMLQVCRGSSQARVYRTKLDD